MSSRKYAVLLGPLLCAATVVAAPVAPAQDNDASGGNGDHFDSPVGFRRQAALVPSLDRTPTSPAPPRLASVRTLDTTRYAPLVLHEAFASIEHRSGHTRRNALLLGGVGVLTFAGLWALPENTSKWSEEDRRFSKFLGAYRSLPTWDADPWPWNYVAHPVFGMYTYLMERNYDASPWRSFLFSSAASVGWEYVYEAWMEHPSTQDLLFTSTTGAILGELIHRYTRRAARDGFNIGEKVVVTLLNPAFTVQHGFRPRQAPPRRGISPLARAEARRRPPSATIPALAPMNPYAASRTPLFAPALVEPHEGWRRTATVEYASAAEAARATSGSSSRLLLDAELLRATFTATRDLGASTFVSGQLELGGAYDGMLDGLLNWFHERVGIRMKVRDRRPRNRFADTLRLSEGPSQARAKSTVFLGDARATIGRRHGAHRQTLLTLTLPTSTAPEGYGRGTVSLGVFHVAQVTIRNRLTVAGTAGAGFTPSRGALREAQHEVFASGSTGLRLRLWGGQSAYYSLFAHTPYYHGTRMPQLDAAELTHDFGWIVRTGAGRELRLGVTEDTHRDDPSLDVVFKLAATW